MATIVEKVLNMGILKRFKKFIPGHGSVLHDWLSDKGSVHSFPLLEGEGLSQVRLRSWVPPPQVTVQALQTDQFETPPSTGAAVVGAAVVGAAVEGAAVVGAAVIGAEVDGAAVVGEAVVGAAVVGAAVGAVVSVNAAVAFVVVLLQLLLVVLGRTAFGRGG
jgi:hypothetical protein